ncbi:hypothetical protein [Sphingobium phenoxybenzoativorans]|uniref:hypothetical protein n=1 Tax=Sphingobium phenoxybenzoativorans TaxID=1592790 RepID=UPI000A57C364|nr:hypothetical protein [Sphingobium phenoxybenzoativorans]
MFHLYISLTSVSLNIIKTALTNALPNVKSSHRCEAMARGLGYRTYASLLADLSSNAEIKANTDGLAFNHYLEQHDFSVSGSTLYRAVAKAALANVATLYPTLTSTGFGIGQWRPGDTAIKRRLLFDKLRDEFFSDFSTEPFLASLAFVSRVQKTKTIRPATNSYWLKHVAENYACSYPDGEELGPIYVSNGLLIAAAIHAGFDVKPHKDEYGREALNAGFNMGKASLYDLDCEIRPEGVRARDRAARKRQQAARRSGYLHIY